jgi:hypothetical protein
MCTGLELLAAGALGVGAAGKVIEGFEGSQVAKLNANVARSNAEILEKTAEIQTLGAELSPARAALEEARLRTQVNKVQGAARVHFAARNQDPAFGSPLLIAGLNEAQGEVDAGIIRASGQVERAERLADAASTAAGAAGSRWQAAAAERQSTASLLSGVFGAATTLLSGVGQWPGLSIGAGASGAIDIRPAWAR